MSFAIGYMGFPFALIFIVLSGQKGIDIRNKMHEIFNAVVTQE